MTEDFRPLFSPLEAYYPRLLTSRHLSHLSTHPPHHQPPSLFSFLSSTPLKLLSPFLSI